MLGVDIGPQVNRVPLRAFFKAETDIEIGIAETIAALTVPEQVAFIPCNKGVSGPLPHIDMTGERSWWLSLAVDDGNDLSPLQNGCRSAHHRFTDSL